MATLPEHSPPTHVRRYARRGWKARFIEALRSGHLNVGLACRLAGVDRSHAYAVRRKDPEFSAAWEDAEGEGWDELVGIAYERAMAGSIPLMIFMLKLLRPEKYDPAWLARWRKFRRADTATLADACEENQQ